MGEFKERASNAIEEFNGFLDNETAAVKKQFPLMPIQTAKALALENILPAYIEYRIQVALSRGNKGDRNATRSKQSDHKEK